MISCLVFLVIDAWMFSVLRGSHEKSVLQDKKELLLALARTAPEQAGGAENWLAEAKKNYPGLHLLYIRNKKKFDATEAFALDADVKALWESRRE